MSSRDVDKRAAVERMKFLSAMPCAHCESWDHSAGGCDLFVAYCARRANTTDLPIRKIASGEVIPEGRTNFSQYGGGYWNGWHRDGDR